MWNVVTGFEEGSCLKLAVIWFTGNFKNHLTQIERT